MEKQVNLCPKIGLLPTGHHYYWSQFPRLKPMVKKMYKELVVILKPMAEIVVPEDIVDIEEKAQKAGELFQKEKVDMVLVFPLTYSPSMRMVPAVKNLNVPIRILNAHKDRSYDYSSADITTYLYHEGVCCVPEFSCALVNIGKKFKVRTGSFCEKRLWQEIDADFKGAAAARFFKNMNIGLIGEAYTHMSDMPIDENKLLRTTGHLLVRPEVEEIEEAYHRVTENELEEMYRQFRKMYAVDNTVTNEHLRFSAKVAIAFDKIIREKYDIYAFGFYWWGEKKLITQIRAQSGLAVSMLTSLGRPGVTEGDVKSAIAMKILDLLGEGGMFAEFFSMDLEKEFLLMGHDGPSNVKMSNGRPRLMHLDIHHGKSGHGLGIDFNMQEGPVTLLNLSQVDTENTFKLIYSVGEVIRGSILNIGNPNCRVKVPRPIHEFMDMWCQEGPSHHIALGIGDHSLALETFAEAMGFQIVRV